MSEPARLLLRPPALVAKVLGRNGVAPADLDSDGWYVVESNTLYWVSEEGGEFYVMWRPCGSTVRIDPLRAGIWMSLLEIGSSHEEAERLSR